MDAIVAEPYGLTDKQKDHDIAYVQGLSNQLLAEMVDALNEFHNTSHGLRYWHILIGYWLQRYVSVAFNRYFTLEQALKNYDVAGTASFDSSAYRLAPADSRAFCYASNDDVWNHVFYSRILNFWGVKTEVDFAPLQGVKGFSLDCNSKAVRKFGVKHIIRKVANFVLPLLSRKRDAFIIESHLPRMEAVKLQLSLGQCPQVWRRPAREYVAFDQERRGSFSIATGNHTGFEKFVRSLLGEVVPICYLEGYDQLVRQVESLPWPTDPRFIFTSNSYAGDEVFKAWTASKVEEGVPYIIGQHGNFQAYRGHLGWPEVVSGDIFLTWGWSNDNPRNVPAFVFKTAGKKQLKHSPDGGLLLIEVHPPHLVTTWDSLFEFGLYQEEQFRFVEALPETIGEGLTVRFHAEYKNHTWSDEQRWKDRSPRTQIETGSAPIRQLIEKSRLVVHSYDSTGIIDTLFWNIPTVCFWHGGLGHLLPSAKPYYELLRNADILHDTPEQAAEMVTAHWEDLGKWWNSSKVQDARKIFCHEYARAEKKPIQTLKHLLTSNKIIVNN